MAGHNIARLSSAVNGMNEDAVEQARKEWVRGQDVITEVTGVLDQSGRDIKNAFGGNSDIGTAAQAVLTEVRSHLERRHSRMGEAAEALTEVGAAITRAKSTATTMPDSAPGEAPRMEGGPYVDDAAEIQAMKRFAAKNRAHTQEVNAYNEADERARLRVEDVNDVFQRAGDVFATMWEPDVKPPETGGRDTGTTGGRGPTRGPGINPHETDGSHAGDGDTGGDGGDAGDDNTGGGNNNGGNNGGGDNGGDGGNGGGGNHGGGNGGGNGGGLHTDPDPFGGGLNGHGSDSHGISIDPHSAGWPAAAPPGSSAVPGSAD